MSLPESGPIDTTREPPLPLAGDRSKRGRANRRNGADAERLVARWLRAHGWPDAERAEKNGWRTPGHVSSDPGDIDKTSPGLYWSVKRCERERLDAWLAELDGKAEGRIGLLVVKRSGKADPGRWWCWLRLDELVLDLLGLPAATIPVFPVRMELGDVALLLVGAGYGVAP